MMINYHFIVIILVYLMFITRELIYILNTIIKSKKLSFLTLSSLIYVAILAVIIVLEYSINIFSNSNFSLRHNFNLIIYHYLALFFTLICFYMFKLGYFNKQKVYHLKSSLSKGKMYFLLFFLTLVSILSLILWASDFGGLSLLIKNSNGIRAGYIVGTGNKSFFKHFVPSSMIVSLTLFHIIFLKREEKNTLIKIVNIFLLLFSFIISYIYILANDGRMLAVTYLLLFFLLKINYDFKFKNKGVASTIILGIFLSVIAIIVIINGDFFLNIIKGKPNNDIHYKLSDNYLKTITSEFSFIMQGVFQAINARFEGKAHYLIVNDVVNGILAWLPSNLKPINLVDVWDYNTILINSNIYGQAPTTIVAQSFYDLGFLGIFIIPYVYGTITRKFECILNSYSNDSFIDAIYISLGFNLAKGLVYFSFYNIMLNIFYIFFSYIIYIVIKKIK